MKKKEAQFRNTPDSEEVEKQNSNEMQHQPSTTRPVLSKVYSMGIGLPLLKNFDCGFRSAAATMELGSLQFLVPAKSMHTNKFVGQVERQATEQVKSTLVQQNVHTYIDIFQKKTARVK